MAALLLDNMLHRAYWGKSNRATITVTAGSEAEGHPFVNMLDHNAGTSFKIGSGAQATITMQLAITGSESTNGFAVYGHNLTPSQGFTIEYDNEVAGTDFSGYNADPYTSNVYLPDETGKAFGVLFDSTLTTKYLKISTLNWTTDSYVSILSLGRWLQQGIELTAPFTPPFSAVSENMIKRNNNGNPLLNSVRSAPTKLSLNLAPFEYDDINATLSGYGTTINGSSELTPKLAQYVSYFCSRFPFFVMHDVGVSGDDNATLIDKREEVYFATIDRTMSQPKYNTPTTLNWRIPAIGYVK